MMFAFRRDRLTQRRTARFRDRMPHPRGALSCVVGSRFRQGAVRRASRRACMSWGRGLSNPISTPVTGWTNPRCARVTPVGKTPGPLPPRCQAPWQRHVATRHRPDRRSAPARNGHVHPDLVGAPRFQPALHKHGRRRRAEPFQQPRAGHGVTALVGKDRLTLAVGRVARQVRGDPQHQPFLERDAGRATQTRIGRVDRPVRQRKIARLAVCASNWAARP